MLDTVIHVPILFFCVHPRMHSGGTPLVLDAAFNFTALDSVSDSATLRAAFARYSTITFPHLSALEASANCRLVGLVVGVASSDESHPQLSTDESYSLSIPLCSGGAAVATAQAATVYGALRALETFSQLVEFDFDSTVVRFPTLDLCSSCVGDVFLLALFFSRST